MQQYHDQAALKGVWNDLQNSSSKSKSIFQLRHFTHGYNVQDVTMLKMPPDPFSRSHGPFKWDFLTLFFSCFFLHFLYNFLHDFHSVFHCLCDHEHCIYVWTINTFMFIFMCVFIIIFVYDFALHQVQLCFITQTTCSAQNFIMIIFHI